MQGANVRLSSAVVSDKGLSEKRPVNEDSFLALVDRGLFAVADGVGGAQAGDFASQTAMEVLHDAFSHVQPNIDSEELLEMAIQRANESIFQMARELPQLDMMATTIVTLQISGNVAALGHVGDSRIYRLAPDGTLTRETNDHSIVAEEVRAGRMTEAQAANHPSRNVISRALGAESTVEVEMRTIMFEPGTKFLLCSDGITRHVTDNEIKNVLANYDSLDAACQEFKRMCYERGAEDNLTALIVEARSANQKIVQAVDEDENTILGDRAATAKIEQNAAISTNGSHRESANPENQKNQIIEQPAAAHSAAAPAKPEAVTAPLDDFPAAENSGNLQSNPTKTRESAAHSSGATHEIELQEQPQSQKKSVHLGSDADIIEQISRREAAQTPAVAPNKFFGYAILLLAGAAVGASLIYALSLMNPPPANAPAANIAATANTTESPIQIAAPPIAAPTAAPAQQQTSDAANKLAANELNTLESLRRSVDSQPRNVADFVSQPQTATDFYFLGRAALQIGEYDKARRNFERAAKLIAELDNANQETLRVDIATAQAALSTLNKKSEDARPLNELIKSKRGSKSNQTDENESER